MRIDKSEPEIHKMIADVINPFLGVIPAAGLEGNHFFNNIKSRQIFHIHTDLCPRIAGIHKKII